jgi:tetratricopeptide (TPR) repeat protein
LITVTRGVVSGFDENQNLKTDAEINPGNSGGAALDDMDSFLGIPSFTISGEDGKLGFIVTLNRIIEWLTTVLKSGLPATSDRIDEAFTGSNLNFSGDNLDQSNKYPRILVKFAAVETLLSERKYEESIPQIQFILEKRPRSALAYHYLGNALLGLGRYREATNQYRHCLSLDPNHIPALGNLGVSLISLSREQEALQIFEQVIDGSDDPAELWTSYNNIAGIYERAKNGALSQSYRSKANELRQAAEQRLSEHTQRRGKGSKLEALLNAMVHAEIKMTE